MPSKERDETLHDVGLEIWEVPPLVPNRQSSNQMMNLFSRKGAMQMVILYNLTIKQIITL